MFLSLFLLKVWSTICENDTMLYNIAEHRVRISSSVSKEDSVIKRLLPSFSPFEVEDDGGEVMLQLVNDNTLKSVPKTDRRLIREVDTGNGMTKVYRCERNETDSDGMQKIVPFGYQFVMRDIQGRECALLIADNTFHNCTCALNGDFFMRTYGLNSCVMLCYSFAASTRDTLLIHASLVRHKGKGYAFTAKSGTGKSTQVSNWLRYIPHCDLMNDDNPIIRYIDGKVFIYGSPWSGKTPCYRNVKAELQGVAMIKRADNNRIEKLPPVMAYTTLLPSCSTMKWDDRVYRANNDTVVKILEVTPIYNLFCLPDRESAEVALKGMGV